MKFVSLDVYFREFMVADFATFFIGFGIQPRMDFQTLLRCRGTNQADHDLKCFQRNALPIAGDVAEQPVLDLIPFAGAGGEMTDLDDHLQLISQALKFRQPQPGARTVAAAAVGCDQQSPRRLIPLAAQTPPPATDGRSREFSRVVT